MHVTAKDIAGLLNGELVEGEPGAISFLANPKYEAYAYTTESSVLLVAKDFEPAEPIKATLIKVDNVYDSLSQLLEHFGQAFAPKSTGIDEQAHVDENAEVDATSTIGAFSLPTVL